MNNLVNIDYKITPKQKRLLDVLANPEHAKKTNEEKARIAGVSVPMLYISLKSPNFIQALRIRGLSESLSLSIPIIKRMSRDALEGKFMQQKTMLEMSGHLSQQPLIQQVINVNPDHKPSEELDEAIMAKIIDVTPTNEYIPIKKD